MVSPPLSYTQTELVMDVLLKKSVNGWVHDQPIRSLAEAANLHAWTAGKAVYELESKGLIRCYRGGPGRGPNSYELLDHVRPVAPNSRSPKMVNHPWIQTSRTDGSFCLKATCKKCGRVVRVTVKTRNRKYSPDFATRKFAQKGMAIKANHAVCHSCPKEEPMNAPSSPAFKAQREMFQLLDEKFSGGQYATGWSDAKIAKETGLSVEFVTEARESAYGKLKVPDELLDMAKEVADAEAMLNEMRHSILAPLSKKVSAAIAKYT